MVNDGTINSWQFCNDKCHFHLMVISDFYQSIIHLFRLIGVLAWILGGALCKLVPYVQGVSVAASVYSLVAVSVDR